MGHKGRLRAVALACAIALLVAACKGNAPQLRADAAGTSRFTDSDINYDGSGGHQAVTALAQQWRFRYNDATCFPPGETRPWGSFATPVVWDQTVYQGFLNGCLVALDTATGALKWQRDFGYQPPKTCTSTNGLGIVSTPAITEEQIAGVSARFLYLHAPDGSLDKLDTTTGATIWSAAVDPPVDPTVNDYFAWGSPLPIPSLGIVVVGMASDCDFPFQRGGIKAFSMTTGAPAWTWWSMPANPDDPLQWDVGGGVWQGMSTDGNAIYAATGSATECGSEPSYQAKNNPAPVPGVFDGVWHACDAPGYQMSLVKIDASSGQLLGSFLAPKASFSDADFGSGTTIWTATIGGVQKQLFGACNKDGWFYALDSQPDATGVLPLVWKTQIASQSVAGESGCLSGAVVDPTTGRMWLSGDVINGTTVTGRVRQVDPATGATVWETPLPANALGSGTINGNGVLAYAGMDWENQPDNGIYILNSHTGEIVETLKDPGDSSVQCPGCTYDQFAQPVWADGALWMSNRTALSAWR